MNEATKIGNTVARAWIESLGGEWAEVAEEKKAEAAFYVYRTSSGSLCLYSKKLDAGEVSWNKVEYIGIIPIAGVTT